MAKIEKIVVVSPPILGARRLKKFRNRLSKFAIPLPPVEIAEGFNKNWLNLNGTPEIAKHIKDNRNIWVKIKLRLNIEPKSTQIRGSELEHILAPGGGKCYIGNIGSAVGHIRAWQYIATLKQPCMVMEDDNFLYPHAVGIFDYVPPVSSQEYLITLYPSFIKEKKDYNQSYFIIEKSNTEEIGSSRNAGAYIITPSAAEKLLSLLPVPVGIPVDKYFLHKAPFPIFTTYTDLANQVGRSINTNTKLTWGKVLNVKTIFRRVINQLS